MKRVAHKKSLDTSNYVNIETGETLGSEIPNLTSVNVYDPDLVLVSSKEYTIIDSVALRYITATFNNADLANILKMTDMIKGVYNVLYNDKVPHTKETLRTDLDYSVNKFRDFLTRLHKGGVISYLDSYVKGIPHKFIILNPNLARKGKTFRKETLKKFDKYDFTKPLAEEIIYPKGKITDKSKKQELSKIEEIEPEKLAYSEQDINLLFETLGW